MPSTSAWIETVVDGQRPPLLCVDGHHRTGLDARGGLEQAVGRVGAAVQHEVLDDLAQIERDVVVQHQRGRVHDRHVEPGADRVVEEHRVDRLAHRGMAAEREAQVREAARHERAGTGVVQQTGRLDERDPVAVVLRHARPDRQDARVEDEVARRHADHVDQEPVGARQDLDLALDGVGLALLVERHDHDRRAVPPHAPGVLDEALLAVLQAQAVHDRLALDALESRLDDLELARVDHDRHPADGGLGRDQVEEAAHLLARLEQPVVHVDVDHLGAGLDLRPCDRHRRVAVAGADEPREVRRPRDVRSLADVAEPALLRDRDGLEPGDPETRNARGGDARGSSSHRLGDRADVLGRAPAAAPDQVHQAVGSPCADVSGHLVRAHVVVAEVVRQPGVRVRADRDARDPRELGEVRAQLGRAERAVQADGDGRHVLDGDPERLGRLPAQRAAGAIRDRPGQDHREAAAERVERVLDRGDRRLGVQRVEDGLDQQDVGSAVDQPAGRIAVRVAQSREGDRAERGIGHVRGQRGCAARGSEHACDEPGSPVGLLCEIRLGAGEPGGLAVDLGGELSELVLGQRDRGRVERVRLDDVGAGGEVRPVDLAHRVGLREAQEVVQALQVDLPVGEALAAVVGVIEAQFLDLGAHRPVEHDDALGEQARQRIGAMPRHRRTDQLRLSLPTRLRSTHPIRAWHHAPCGAGCRGVMGPEPSASLDVERASARNRANSSEGAGRTRLMGQSRQRSGEADDQLRRLERDVELGAVADAVEHDPVGMRQPVVAEARGAAGQGRSRSSVPHTTRTGQVMRSASSGQPSRSAYSTRGPTAWQAAAPTIWWASSSRGMCSNLVAVYCVARRRPSVVATIASAWGAAARSCSCIVVKCPSVSLNVSSPGAQPPAGASATTEEPDRARRAGARRSRQASFRRCAPARNPRRPWRARPRRRARPSSRPQSVAPPAWPGSVGASTS